MALTLGQRTAVRTWKALWPKGIPVEAFRQAMEVSALASAQTTGIAPTPKRKRASRAKGLGHVSKNTGTDDVKPAKAASSTKAAGGSSELTIQAAAQKFNVSLKDLRAAVKAGDLKVQKKGNFEVVDPSAVEALLETQPEAQA